MDIPQPFLPQVMGGCEGQKGPTSGEDSPGKWTSWLILFVLVLLNSPFVKHIHPAKDA